MGNMKSEVKQELVQKYQQICEFSGSEKCMKTLWKTATLDLWL